MLWFVLFILCGPIVVFGGMMLTVAFGLNLFASMVIMFIGVAIAIDTPINIITIEANMPIPNDTESIIPPKTTMGPHKINKINHNIIKLLG
jgi:hypothetical protein